MHQGTFNLTDFLYVANIINSDRYAALGPNLVSNFIRNVKC